jgi:hypothetical protein
MDSFCHTGFSACIEVKYAEFNFVEYALQTLLAIPTVLTITTVAF